MSKKEFVLDEDKTGIMSILGMTHFVYEEDGRLSMTVPVTEAMLNPNGITHGGVVFTLCDTLAGGYFHQLGKKPVTLSSNIVYHAPSRAGDVLTGYASCRKNGHRTGVALVEIYNQDHVFIAENTAVVYFVD